MITTGSIPEALSGSIRGPKGFVSAMPMLKLGKVPAHHHRRHTAFPKKREAYHTPAGRDAYQAGQVS